MKNLILFCKWFIFFVQSFGDLTHKPLLVDLTVEEGQRLKVIYGSCSGFHAVDVDSGAVYDIYLPTHVSTTQTRTITVHTEPHRHKLGWRIHPWLISLSDSDQHPIPRHHHPPQHGRYRAVGLLWGRRRLREHVRTYHQRRGATVGGDAHLGRYVGFQILSGLEMWSSSFFFWKSSSKDLHTCVAQNLATLWGGEIPTVPVCLRSHR